MMWWKLAWRNIFRNGRRTFLSALIVGIGLAAMMLTDALVAGLSKGMVEIATSNLMGHGQIHSRAYTEEASIDHAIEDLQTIEARLKGNPNVLAFSPRIKAAAMISSARAVSSILLTGLVPDRERQIISLPRHIVEGQFLDTKNGIVIGKSLAEFLEVGLGDRIVLTLSQAGTGDLSQQLVRVNGIFAYGSQALDRGLAFITLEKGRELTGVQTAHEVAVRLHDIPSQADHPVWASVTSEKNVARGWQELLPELSAALKMTGWSTGIMAVILFAVISLAVINTIFMSLHERMFEFAVVRAIGTRASRVGWLILQEAVSLGVLSSVIGLILGTIVVFSFNGIGINYGGMEVAGVAMTNRIYPLPQWEQFVVFPPIIVLLTTLAAVYPAWSASRLVPADAMRKSL